MREMKVWHEERVRQEIDDERRARQRKMKKCGDREMSETRGWGRIDNRGLCGSQITKIKINYMAIKSAIKK